jgi:hypothetical protein
MFSFRFVGFLFDLYGVDIFYPDVLLAILVEKYLMIVSRDLKKDGLKKVMSVDEFAYTL